MNPTAVLRGALCSLLVATFLSASVHGQDFEREPIEYSRHAPDNRVSRLMGELQSGKENLKHEPQFGYLRSLLSALEVPQSSQMLVFSKTSMQRDRISPRTPRAIYFSDDTYIGFCQSGEVLEVSTVDKDLGAVFYTLNQDQQERPRLIRQTESCLICHSSSSTQGVPGHVVRSVYSDAGGLPILSSGSFRTNHASPLSERWGGWYVTGTHGAQKHLGNLVVRGREEPEQIDNSAGQNVTDLAARIKTEDYLSPHSDIVALMVLEHQADTQNAITHASFATRQAIWYEELLTRELKEPAGERRDSTKSRIKSACEPLLERLFFCDEPRLTHRIEGTSKFAEEFVRRGPCDQRGRSLRELDLTSRMFCYPCSYLVYSPAFAAIPPDAKDYLFRRMHEILGGKDKSEKFQHLSASDREAIRDILLETLPDFRARGG